MEQSLRVYRRHTKACSHSYIKPIYDGDRSVQDCSCPLCIEGYLRKEIDAKGKPKRIRHFPLQTTRWDSSETKWDEFLTNGSLTAPAGGIEALQGDKVTVEDAVKFFLRVRGGIG